MSASCMLQSQYIESRGAMGKPGKPPLTNTAVSSGGRGLYVFSDGLSFVNRGVGLDE